MVRTFNDVVNGAESGQKAANRALQSWQYLIAKAHNRQIVRYGELGSLMGYTDNRPLRPILACLMWYCEQNDLPPLTILVVNQTGVPGDGFTAAEWEVYHQERENVFNYEWYGLVPPTVEQLREAHLKGWYSRQTTQALADAAHV